MDIPISVEADALQQAIHDVRRAALLLEESTTVASRRVAGLLADWDGAAARGFASAFDEWQAAADRCVRALEAIGSTIGMTRADFMARDSGAAAQISAITTQLPAQLPGSGR